MNGYEITGGGFRRVVKNQCEECSADSALSARGKTSHAECAENAEVWAMNVDAITGDVLDSAIKVHQKFGPGLLESVYEKILSIELEKRGHRVECQKALPIRYEDRLIPDAFRMDLLVDGVVVVELKSTAQMPPVYFKQLRTYLVLSGLHVGLLINFGMNTLKEGFKRIVNNYCEECSADSALSARGKMSHTENAENAEV